MLERSCCSERNEVTRACSSAETEARDDDGEVEERIVP